MLLLEKLISLPPKATLPAAPLVALTEAIGSGRFLQTALALAEPEIGATFISVFCQGDRDSPLLVGTACTGDAQRATQAAQGYRHHMTEDRNTALLAGESGSGDFLTVQTAQSIPSFTYRRDCYDRPGLCERISLVRRRPDYGLSVSLYADVERGPFTPAERLSSRPLLGLLTAAAERHVAFSLRGRTWQEQDVQTRLALTYPDLTRREREVAAMTIKGRTAAEIAAILALSETTVITHRKRAYRRMNVSSLRELMASF